MSDPSDLVRRLLRRRVEHGLDTTVAPTQQPAPTTVWGLCDEYVENDFDAMDDDDNRNAAYARAFAAVPSSHQRWLEIGCGAAATLTRLALQHGPPEARLCAFEVNHQSAVAAAKAIGDEEGAERVTIVVGRSTQHELLPQPVAHAPFDVVLHEVFGVFASSEGAAPMLDHARAYYLERRPRASLSLSSSARRRGSYRALCDSVKVWRQAEPQRPLRGAISRGAAKPAAANASTAIAAAPSRSSPMAIPSRAATFFTPIEITPKALDGCDDVYVDHPERPSVLLVPCAPLDKLSLSHTSSLLEIHRFGAGEALNGTQAREGVFGLSRDGVLNGLGVFIWVDLGIGGPSRAHAAASAADAGPLLGTFPFGDASLLSTQGAGAGGAGDGPPSPPPPLNDFTSLYTPQTVSLCTHATNWMNPLLLLPRPVQVKRGQRLLVRSIARAGSERPSFRFELALIGHGRPAENGEDDVFGLGCVEVGLEQLYPDYGV